MKVRFAAPALLLIVSASPPAHASILSASSSAGHVHAQSVDYLSVTAVQDGLNASMTDQTRISSAGALGGTFSPSSSNGGFLVTTVGSSGSGSLVGSFGGGEVAIPNRHRAPLKLGNGGNSVGGISEHHRDPSHRHGGGVQAAPEPSTWLLLGTGLGMFGFYVAMRRRKAASM